jgi:hypothetical protein
MAVLRTLDVYPGSRILIFTHPGSRISDPGPRIQQQQQKRVVKKIVNYFIFEMLKKKIWAIFQRIIEHFTKKLSLSFQKFRKKPILDPGVKKAPDPGSGSATLLYERTKTKLTFSAMQASRGFLVSGQAQHGFSFLPSGPASERERISVSDPDWIRGQKCPPKNEEISCLTHSLLGWRLYLEPECALYGLSRHI